MGLIVPDLVDRIEFLPPFNSAAGGTLTNAWNREFRAENSFWQEITTINSSHPRHGATYRRLHLVII